jgi:hypothetical protein
MKKRTLFAAILGLLYLSINAQNNFELGRVSIPELEQKLHPTDTTAAAAILYKKARTFFEFFPGQGYVINHEYEIRFKIYKKEGLSWANFQVPYHAEINNTPADKLKFSNCVTYNLEGGKIVATKLNIEGNFNVNYNKYWNEASITMPNVKVGSVFEIKYVIKSEHIVRFPVFYYQYSIPVNYAEYFTDIPEIYIYKPIAIGYSKVASDIKIVEANKSYSYKYGQYEAVVIKYIVSTHKAENIPAQKEEEYVDNISNYRSSIHHELERTRYPGEDVKDYALTWEGVAKSIYEDEDFGRELKKDNYFKEDLTKIIENAKTESEKMELIFKFVQNKMNWNNDYGIYTDKGVKQSYERSTGNKAEINFILISMLKSAGIDTSPVLITTVGGGIPVYPNRTVFNSVIAAAQADGNQFLLDATSKFSTINALPLEDLNWTGRLIKKDGSSLEIKMATDKLSAENISLMAVLNDDGKIVGKGRILKTDYSAERFRDNYANENEDEYLEKFEVRLGAIQISDYTIENKKTNIEKPISETFTFSSENSFDRIGNKMYINPLLFFTDSTNPFVQEKRELPIYFQYPKQEKYNISIEIPKGYVVESLPKPIKLVTGENVGSFSFNIQQVENKIQIVVSQSIIGTLISADFYDVLKVFYQKIIDKQNEKIVLKKI